MKYDPALDGNGFDDPAARPQEHHRRLRHGGGGDDGQGNARGSDHVRKDALRTPLGECSTTMQVAIVSDIHGNRHALEAVIDDVEANTDATEMWCLGDVVGYGADPNDCCALVREHARVCLAGNHDLAVTGALDARRVLAPARRSRPAGRRRCSTTSTARGCRASSRKGASGGVGLYHASPRDPIWEYVLIALLAELCLDAMPERLALRRATRTWRCPSTAPRASRRPGAACRGGDSADLRAGEWLMNPGSVGQPRDGDARAAWLLLDTDASARPSGSAPRTTSPARRRRSAPPACRTPSPSASGTVNEDARPSAPPGSAARWRDGVRRRLRRRPIGPDPRLRRGHPDLRARPGRLGAPGRRVRRRRAGLEPRARCGHQASRPPWIRACKRRLQSGIDNLRKRVPDDCQQTTSTQTQAPTTTQAPDTQTETTQTETHADRDHADRDDDDTDHDAAGHDLHAHDPGRHERRGDGAMRPGELLVDRYELGDRLGVGGMSTVVGAFDRRLEREVAVKLLAEHLADDHQFVERFRREALAAARLVHPNIVQVFDFGLDEKSHRQYIVMELRQRAVGGRDPQGRGPHGPRATRSRWSPRRARGLEYAHRNGVVHRDVKPGNLLRSLDGVVKLADFGIAKAMSDESAITQIGSVLGTAAYLAPEQAAGESAGPSADIYALGVVTYQLMSGRLPYEANSLTELALMQQREMPPALHEIAPGISPQLSAAVDRALALDPADRFASADEMRAALEAGASRRRPGDVGDAGRGRRRHRRHHRPRRDRGHRRCRAGRGAPAAPAAPAARAPLARRRPSPRRRPRRSRERAAAPARRKPRSGFRQTMGMFLILVLLAAGGAAAVIATSGSTDAVNLRQVVYDNVQQGVDAVKGLVQDNTRRSSGAHVEMRAARSSHR